MVAKFSIWNEEKRIHKKEWVFRLVKENDNSDVTLQAVDKNIGNVIASILYIDSYTGKIGLCDAVDNVLKSEGYGLQGLCIDDDTGEIIIG